MESKINRSSIPCWFETQPMGCRKPHCVFLHKKIRNLGSDDEQVASDGLILPVMTNANNSDVNNDSNSNTSINCLTNNNIKSRDDTSKIKLFDDSDYMNQSLSNLNESTTHNINIEPISISINCDEESDNENELSAINRSNHNKSKSDSEINNYNSPNNKNSSKNYGIKTLEQIRMEKVFNHQSDDSINDSNSSDNFKNDSINKNQKSINKDLRVKIKRRTNNDNDSKPSVSNFNNDSSAQQIDSPPNFGIKTLDQIRREREEAANNKQNLDNDRRQNFLKENQELRGEKRSASDPLSAVVKIRRTGPATTSSLKAQKIVSEKISSSYENKVTSTNSELNDLSAVSSTDSSSQQRLKSVDIDLDDFDFLDGDSSNNIDTNTIDDEDDELMREINQVINS